jgi:peptide/nickel transport system substrate-binding protein
MFVDFKPGDMLRGKINPNYHVANRPHFDEVEIKGGGDAVSAARAVLQTGEYDYAWNMQVEDEILLKLEAAGNGKVTIWPSGNVEFIMLNSTIPQPRSTASAPASRPSIRCSAIRRSGRRSTC